MKLTLLPVKHLQKDSTSLETDKRGEGGMDKTKSIWMLVHMILNTMRLQLPL